MLEIVTNIPLAQCPKLNQMEQSAIVPIGTIGLEEKNGNFIIWNNLVGTKKFDGKKFGTIFLEEKFLNFVGKNLDQSFWNF